MKYFTLYLFFIFIGIISAQENYEHLGDSVISWKSSVHLSWNDFQGETESLDYAEAMTGYKINILPKNVIVDEQDRIQGYETLTVEARFYKKHSWTSTKSLTLLKHEQLHFDIAELYARKIRQNFEVLKLKKEARFSTYWENYSNLWKACRQFQKLYDIDTHHGAKIETNRVWGQRIERELEELKEYK